MSERKNEIFSADQVPPAMRRDVMRDDFHMDVPAQCVPLPSQGKVYSSSSPLCGKETIDIRSMTAREEDILTSRALIKKGTVISELLKSCILTPGVDIDSMLAGDRNAIMVAIRITGYGRNYDAEIQCQDCNEKVEATFDLAALEIKRLEIDPVEEGQNAFAFELPISKKKIVFKFLTGVDEQDLIQEAERRRKTLGSSSDSLVTGKLLRSIVSIDGMMDRSKIGIFVKNMPAGDSRSLRKFIEANEPGIHMKGWTTCPQCSTQQEVPMPMGIKFFWPDA